MIQEKVEKHKKKIAQNLNKIEEDIYFSSPFYLCIVEGFESVCLSPEKPVLC